MARLLADENFPLPVVTALKHLGHDVITFQDTGKAGQQIPDEAVLELATQTECVLLTLNRKHFIGLHIEKPNHAGIIAYTCDSDFEAQADRIDASIENQPTMSGQLIRVNRPSE